MTIFNAVNKKELRKELRNKMSPIEGLLWMHIRNKQLGHKFRRQHGIGNYVVDFYCPGLKFVIEIDGNEHFDNDAIKYDIDRTKYLNNLGIRVKRYTNLDIKNNLESVLNDLIKYMDNPS